MADQMKTKTASGIEVTLHDRAKAAEVILREGEREFRWTALTEQEKPSTDSLACESLSDDDADEDEEVIVLPEDPRPTEEEVRIARELHGPWATQHAKARRLTLAAKLIDLAGPDQPNEFAREAESIRAEIELICDWVAENLHEFPAHRSAESGIVDGPDRFLCLSDSIPMVAPYDTSKGITEWVLASLRVLGLWNDLAE